MKRPIRQELDRRAAQSTRERILREAEVRQRTGLSRPTRWRLTKQGKFPAPIKITEHAVGWLEREVDEWIASRERAA